MRGPHLPKNKKSQHKAGYGDGRCESWDPFPPGPLENRGEMSPGIGPWQNEGQIPDPLLWHSPCTSQPETAPAELCWHISWQRSSRGAE